MVEHPLKASLDVLAKQNISQDVRRVLRLDRAEQIVHEYDLKQYKAALKVVKYYEQRYGKPK